VILETRKSEIVSPLCVIKDPIWLGHGGITELHIQCLYRYLYINVVCRYVFFMSRPWQPGHFTID
jgi:hypothetical protein